MRLTDSVGVNTGAVYSVSMWIYPTATGSFRELFSQSEALGFYWNGQEFGFSNTLNQYSNVLSLNTWHHVVGVVNGTAITIYVEGKLNASFASEGASFQTIKIGGDGNAGDEFPGKIDDVRIYNRALSAQEVAQLYKLGTATVAHSNTTSLTSGLVGYWPFDGNTTNWTTDTTQDMSGNGNTLTLQNLPTTTSPVIGKIGGALFFPGASNTIYINNTVSGTFTTFSLSFWQYQTALGSDNSGGEIVPIRFGGTSFYPLDGDANYRVVNGNFQCHSPNASGLVGSAVNADYLKRWRHLVFTFSGTTMNVYRDGIFQATCDTTGSTNTVTNPQLQIGNAFAGRDLVGKLDDVRIYNRALSAQEVQHLYLLGK
jgi:hypothetical protein